MLGYLTIFVAMLAGYAGVAPWAIAASAIALTSISYVQFQRLYERGSELGLTEIVESTLIRSLFNAVVASGIAYGLGWLVRIL